MIKRLLINIFICLFIVSAAFAGGSSPAAAIAFRPQMDYGLDLNTVYYPPDLLDQFLNNAYTAQLEGFRESSLYAISDSGMIAYRLILEPSFMRPLCIRVEISPDQRSGMLFYKRLSKYNEESPCELVVQESKILSGSQVNSLIKAMDRLGFWSIPETGGDSGLDGDTVIIEGVRNGVYHVVKRWEPQDNVFDMSVFFYQLVSPGDWRELFKDDLN
jgi:hypothetical protein